MPPMLLRPQDATAKPPNTLAEEMIQQSLTSEKLEILGIGTAIPLTCSTVGIATSIARLYVTKILLDHVQTSIGDFEAIYFMMTTKETNELADAVQKLEKEMQFNRAGPGGQIVLVSKAVETRRITTTCLYKIREFPMIKISGAGFAIEPAVSAALQVMRLSREPVRIEAVSIETLAVKDSDKDKETRPGKQTTALNIYLKRGKGYERDSDFARALHELKIN